MEETASPVRQYSQNSIQIALCIYGKILTKFHEYQDPIAG
jgi:hypothetical protein